MGVKIDSRKVRAGEKWIFRKTTNMTAGVRPLRWVGSYTPPPLKICLFKLFKGIFFLNCRFFLFLKWKITTHMAMRIFFGGFFG